MIQKTLKFACVYKFPKTVKYGFVLILWLKKGVVLYTKGSDTRDFTVTLMLHFSLELLCVHQSLRSFHVFTHETRGGISGLVCWLQFTSTWFDLLRVFFSKKKKISSGIVHLEVFGSRTVHFVSALLSGVLISCAETMTRAERWRHLLIQFARLWVVFSPVRLELVWSRW